MTSAVAPVIVQYFLFLHKRKQYAASTLSCWWSVFKKFWTTCFSDKPVIENCASLVNDKLRQWAKRESVKRSAVFFACELREFFDSPDTAENLVVKFYTAIGLSFAGRGIEIQPVSRSDVHKLQRVSDGQIYYGVDFERFVKRHFFL